MTEAIARIAARRKARRLTWINATAIPPYASGGTRHFELGRELVARGWEVSIVASDFNLATRGYTRRTSSDDRSVHIETIDGVEFRWLWAAPYQRNDHRRVWNWLSFCRSVLAKGAARNAPSVIIGSSPQPFAALGAMLLARREKVPFVFEVRDLWPESLAVGGRSKGIAYYGIQLVVKYLYRSAVRIIVLAEGVAEYLASRGYDRDCIALVPNGVSVADFEGVTRVDRPQLRLIYAGAHGPANGLDVLLDVALLLADEPLVRFTLVGDGPDKARLVALATQRGLSNVEFLPPVPKAGMPELLAGCDAGLMILRDIPLFRFGVSPNKLFDYWGAGLPVVNNVAGEVAALVDRSKAGVNTAGADAASLASAIRSMLKTSPAERRAAGDRGRAWVRAERDRPVVARRLAAVLESVC